MNERSHPLGVSLEIKTAAVDIEVKANQEFNHTFIP